MFYLVKQVWPLGSAVVEAALGDWQSPEDSVHQLFSQVTKMYLFWCWFAGFFLVLCWQAALRLMRNAYRRLVKGKFFAVLRFMVRHWRICFMILAGVRLLYRLHTGGLSIDNVLDGLAINILSN